MSKRVYAVLAIVLFLLLTSPGWVAAGDITPHAAASAALVVTMTIVLLRDLTDRFPRF